MKAARETYRRDIDFSPQWIFPKEVFKDGNGLLALFSYLCASGANSIVVMLFVYRRPEIANFKNVKVNGPGRLYLDVTCRFTSHWVFGDTSGVVAGSVTSFVNTQKDMELQATALKGIVRSSDEGLFYLFPIQDVSTLQQTKAHLTCAIDVLSHPEECSPEQRLDAVRTLNSLVAALSVHDDDHYNAFDSALEGGNVQ